ncbi:MAG: hypothetical protein NWE95_04310 [Candidatus Bathyarchaeota archaeon]|nr:hypothetical protein [Candidatus Bathyarchaeota archaeon]
MPSIIPGYVYSLFAALVVGTIIVAACSAQTLGIKNDALNQQLTNIDEYVAVQSLTLLSQTSGNNYSAKQYLEIPSHIGNQIFWIRIANDSSRAWVESGFGTNATTSQLCVYIPASVVASGTFISNSGRALLSCHFENQIAILTLSSE